MKKTEVILGLAGNPNTGKSTIFNALTGLKQHTGNWSGKTVTNAKGSFTLEDTSFTIYDLPGIYSLSSDSAEECCAKEFICSAQTDLILVVVDATSLERNLTLALQIMELTDHVILCLNLMDEAEKKGIIIDQKALSQQLGIPVIATSARAGKGIPELKNMLLAGIRGELPFSPQRTMLSESLETLLTEYEKTVTHLLPPEIPSHHFLLQLLEGDMYFLESMEDKLDDTELLELSYRMDMAESWLEQKGYTKETLQEEKSLCFLQRSQTIAAKVSHKTQPFSQKKEQLLDKLFLSPATGIPLMLLLLGVIFWITIVGANVPSNLLMGLFSQAGEEFGAFLLWCNTPHWLYGLLKDGIFLTVSWVVSVMLPPMAIFFPLFTLLEDFGLLPRIAFHMDGLFQKSHAHGKQALTMCMGFGCNAAGVTACRIIDSPRERLIAILTNNFVPCNGRFPTIIMLTSIFFAGGNPLLAGGFVLIVLVISVCITLLMSRFLGATLLKGIPSSFILELPPYRKPQIGKVIIRSVIDRTIFVLGRAICVSIPAGALIWLLQNSTFHDVTLLQLLAQGLEPLGVLMGMSGIILAAFLLGIPANEIVIPILLMCYAQSGMLIEMTDMTELGNLLRANGWTALTALCTVLFSLNHFPCATTIWTIAKETKSLRWTALSFVLPTAVGIFLCVVVQQVGNLFF